MEYVIMTVLVSLIILAIVLLIQFLIAKEFYYVACRKGYEQKKYLWLPFFLGIIGYLLVIALPICNEYKTSRIYESDKMSIPSGIGMVETASKNSSKKTKELIILEDGSWKCPECNNTCDERVKRCSCGAKKSDYIY